ncbi:MAG: FkbM family methyltransferase [Bacteroidia bacterium]
MNLKELIIKGIVSILPRAVKNTLSAKTDGARSSYSQEGEDMVLERFFEDRRTGFFIDIGAHHPTRFSNTYHFYQKGWRGINIDATPGSMIPFNKIRPGDKNIEMGVSSKEGEMVYFLFDEPALNTFNEERANFLLTTTKYKLAKKIPVKVATLKTILDQNLGKDQQIDFLTIDVEGLDYEILASNDWEKYRPNMVLAEDLHGSLEDLSKSKLYNLMRQHNYKAVGRTLNTFFFQDATKK